ncbi:MAG: hypothetical protein BM564_13225, partial [Bacteroidetes bacterium MedPE-SWsnd-G2]
MFLLVVHFGHAQLLQKRIGISNVNDRIIHILDDEGIDLTCGAVLTNNELKLELTEDEIERIKARGITFNVLIEDLTLFYSERAKRDLPKAKRELEQEKALSLVQRSYSVDELINNTGQYNECDEIDWAVPTNWNLNPNSVTNTFGGCLTYDMVLQELDDMRAQYPNLISAKTDASPTNQTTIEGRTVFYVRISDNPDVDESGEPETLYQSLIHSRESATVMNQLYFMWYLLENYATDQAIQNLVNNQALYFIPVFNPDGFVYNQTVAPNGGGGQRKNMNVTDGCGGYSDGIDLNRNSAYYWGNGGSSADPCNGTYMGSGQFSENETQIMRDFFLLHDFPLALNHHSYKNAMLHAYAGTNITNPRPDEYSMYNHEMTKYNRYAHGPSTSISSLNSGNMNDWMLGGPAGTSANGTPTGTGSGKNTMAWTPENGLSSEGTGGSYGGFWPSPSNFLPIAKRAMRMNFLAAYFSGKYAKLYDLNQNDLSSLSGNLDFAVERLGQTAGDFTVTITPVSNVATVGSPVIISGLNVLEQSEISIPYTLDPSVVANDIIEFKVTLTNDYSSDNVLYEANITKAFAPTVEIVDNPDTDNLTNWTSSGGTWYTTSDAYSGTTAISTTNGGSYSNNESKTLELNTTLDLSSNTASLIQFYGKWDLERSFDYVQIEASTNGSSWTPLCGTLTKAGAPDANNTYSGKGTSDRQFQPDDEPLYDGDMQDKWHMEEIVIDISNNSAFYNQSTVYIRFNFNTDSTNREDSYYNADFLGFTFDDFKVVAVNIPCVTDVPTGLTTSFVSVTSATIDWDHIPSATYDIRYREVGTSTWTEVTDIAVNTYDISGLTATTDYEFQVSTRCTTNTSAYSTSGLFTTTATVPCTGAAINSFPYSEGFESDFGDWTNDSDSDFNWTRDSNGTPSNNTGPSSASEGNIYIYTESSDPNYPTKKAYLVSPCFELLGYENANLSFDYHMFGGNMGALTLQASIDDGATYTDIFTVSGEQHGSAGATWTTENVDLSIYDGQTLKLRFYGLTGTGWQGDMAVDDINLTATVALTTYYHDFDNDSYGDPLDSMDAASQPAGYVLDNSDCDDTNVNVNPAAIEICDGIDNNCDGSIDEGLTTTYYADSDNDGYGDAGNSVQACSQPVNFVTNNLDCNDSNININPDTVWYLDADNDGFGISTLTQCANPGAGYSTTVIPVNDCDDSDVNINVNTVWYLDADLDGYAASTLTQCANPGAGYSTSVLPVTDCDDTDANINPDTVWYLDADLDGYAISTLTQCANPGAGYSTTVVPVT